MDFACNTIRVEVISDADWQNFTGEGLKHSPETPASSLNI